MSQATLDRGTAVAPVPVATAHELLPYALFGGLLLALLVYIVGAEQGATTLLGGETVHEWVHDARHLLGFPCH